MGAHVNSLLCLGDSYTIGEGVALHDSFPYQLIQMLRNAQYAFYAPEIVAKTGWTTFELAEHLLHHTYLPHYDFVTLLIGVNNQYRNLPLEDFVNDYDFLVRKAIHFANNNTNRVIALSIPDWGVTPFAKDRDEAAITSAINAFNEKAENICTKKNVCFVDITASTRIAKQDPTLLTADGLHYSGKEMKDWAEILANIIATEIDNSRK
jgi:lysophospholipase L1-like esterase